MTALVDEELLERSPQDTRLPKVTSHATSEIRRRLASPKTLWCAGCSNGIVTRALIDAILSLELDPDKVCVVAGIGCAGRITAYLDYSTVHTTHGRALAVATGAKLADPSLHVIVVMGDGDCVAIGGNHLIHAARRNIEPHGARLQQLDLRHDRRPDEPHHLRGRTVDHERVRQHRAGLRHLRAGACRGGDLRRPRHPVRVRQALAAHRRRHRARRVRVRRGDGRRAPPTTAARTGSPARRP